MNLKRSLIASTLSAAVVASSLTGTVTWAVTRDDETPAAATSQVARSFDPPTWTPPTSDTPDETEDGDATADESTGVVLIETTLTDGEAAGTGLVLDASGVVLTNYHVVEGSTSVVVTIATTGETYDAEVVGSDRVSDIAVLQLEGASDLDTVALDDDGDPAVGDAVTAVGNAYGQGYLSASSGSVVALDQPVTTTTESLTGLIQADAAVVGGYSGGALLDDEGEVVGVTTAASTGGVPESYAIPVDDALAIAEQIESGVESGDVQIGASAYLGVALVETTAGPGVVEVEPGTAAAEAGLAEGDVLLAVGGHRVRSIDVLQSVLAAYAPGDRTTLRWRSSDGAVHRATATLGSSPIA